MTNLNSQEEKCTTCTAYHEFTSLLAKGLTLEEAFHTVLDEVIEELYEDGFQVGFKEGYIASLESLHQTSKLTIEKLREDKCDCDGCCEGE